MSLWLNAGVPTPTVARRAGHSVDVLLRVYANCIDGDDEIANQRASPERCAEVDLRKRGARHPAYIPRTAADDRIWRLTAAYDRPNKIHLREAFALVRRCFARCAEGEGFEPSRTVTSPSGFQDRRHRPLGEPSWLRKHLGAVPHGGGWSVAGPQRRPAVFSSGTGSYFLTPGHRREPSQSARWPRSAGRRCSWCTS